MGLALLQNATNVCVGGVSGDDDAGRWVGVRERDGGQQEVFAVVEALLHGLGPV